MKRLAQITAVILVTVIGALALWQMREAAQLLLVALAVASGVEPAVQRIMERGLGRSKAVAVAYVGALAALSAVVLFFGSLASAEVATVVERLPAWYGQARTALANSGGWASDIGAGLPTPETLTATVTGNQGQDVLGLVLGVAGHLATLATLAVSAATLGFYWLLDRQRIERLWLSLLPLDTRTTARGVWQQVYDEVGIYVRGESAIVALSTLALLSVYGALEVPGAGLLALVGGLAQVVPLLGLPLAVAVGVSAALTQGPVTGALTLAGSVYVLSVIRVVIGRRMYESGINVNPVLVMFMIIALADIGGVWMILLAPPLAAALQASVRIMTSDQRAAARPVATGAVQASALRARLDAVETGLAERGASDPRLTGMLVRARRLVDEAAESLPETSPDVTRPGELPTARLQA
ncbi:MAG: hypothetical protein RLZZ387_24 [Chloroflexota bacterium]|jgi:predicted PurR-regulated permease PerM